MSSKQNKTDMQRIWNISIIAAIICVIMVLFTFFKFDDSNQKIAEATPDPSEIPEDIEIYETSETAEESFNKEDPSIIIEESSEEIVEEVIPEFKTYTIQAGDSLWSIANQYYGDGSLYTKIASDNGIKNSNLISIGQELKIYDADFTPEIVENSIEQVEETNQNNSNSNLEYIGNFRITGYDPYCVHCCGKADGITSSGRKAVYNYSVGCNSLPLGTELYIEGYGYYRVDDRGGMAGDLIDIACESHAACYNVTNYNIPVYIVK